jgi:hypothetical protein
MTIGWRVAALAGVLALAGPLAAAAAEPPPLAPPGAPYENCGLLVEPVGSSVRPLDDFDPSDPLTPLSPPASTPDARISAVLCVRDSILPAAFDYRILSDMRLPLFIQDGARTVAIEAKDSSLSMGLAAGPLLSPSEVATMRARLDAMNTPFRAALAAQASPPPPRTMAKVDLAKAYAPADLALLLGVIARTGIPLTVDMFSVPMAAHGGFSGCPSGAQKKFAKAYQAGLADRAGAIRSAIAAQYDPPFSHDELATLDRYYQIAPMQLVGGPALPKGRRLSAAEAAESQALFKTAAVGRYVAGFPTAIAPMMEGLADLATDSLHQVCPAKQDQRVNSAGLQAVYRNPAAPQPGPTGGR